MNLYTNIAEYYDLEDEEFNNDDIEFYLNYANKVKGDILELGCGTGRVSLLLAEKGYNVTSLDLSNEMLKQFEKKIVKKRYLNERIKIVHSNMSDFNLNKKFNLIIAPGRAFQAICDKQDAKKALHCIYDHLKQDGLFILDLFNPNSFLNEEYCFEPIIVYEKKYNDRKITMRYKCSKVDKFEQLVYSRYTIIDESKNIKRELFDDNVLRYYYIEDICRVLKSCGFNVIETYGWFDRSPLENNREIIIVADI